MSLTPIGEPRQKITVASLRENKQHHQPITCLTAYDYASARLVDEAGIDIKGHGEEDHDSEDHDTEDHDAMGELLVRSPSMFSVIGTPRQNVDMAQHEHAPLTGTTPTCSTGRLKS